MTPLFTCIYITFPDDCKVVCEDCGVLVITGSLDDWKVYCYNPFEILNTHTTDDAKEYTVCVHPKKRYCFISKSVPVYCFPKNSKITHCKIPYSTRKHHTYFLGNELNFSLIFQSYKEQESSILSRLQPISQYLLTACERCCLCFMSTHESLLFCNMIHWQIRHLYKTIINGSHLTRSNIFEKIEQMVVEYVHSISKSTINSYIGEQGNSISYTFPHLLLYYLSDSDNNVIGVLCRKIIEQLDKYVDGKIMARIFSLPLESKWWKHGSYLSINNNPTSTIIKTEIQDCFKSSERGIKFDIGKVSNESLESLFTEISMISTREQNIGLWELGIRLARCFNLCQVQVNSSL